MESLELRYTPANRLLRPLVPTLYFFILLATIIVTRGENRGAGVLSVLAFLVAVVALRTWLKAWTFRIVADEKGISQSGGFSKEGAAWDEIKSLDFQREGELRSDEPSRQFRPLQSITLRDEENIVVFMGHDFRCTSNSEREKLLQFMQARIAQKPSKKFDY